MTKHAMDSRRRWMMVCLAGLLSACGNGVSTPASDSGAPPGNKPSPSPGDTPAAPIEAVELSMQLAGAGQVVSSPRGLDCTRDCVGTLPLDGGLTLEAVAARGWVFSQWSGDCTQRMGAVCSVAESARATVQARFVRAEAAPVPGTRFSGDMHTHSDHSSDGSLARQAADDAAPGNMPLADIIALVETALDLDFLPFTDHRTYDQHYDPNWRSASVLLIPGEEANGRPHATVHGGIDTIDQNASVEGAADSRVVQESIWMAHSQGAVWVTAHPDRDSTDDNNQPSPRADAVGVDLVEVWNRAENPEAEIAYAENRWNAGWRFGVAGASDNHFKELWALGGTPGRPSTEVQAAVLKERALLDAMRSGRTSIYSRERAAPRLRLSADFDDDPDFEVQAGDEVFVPAGTPGRLRIEVVNGLGARVLVYAAPGRSAEPIADLTPTALMSETFTIEVAAPESPTWFRAEARSLGLAEPASLLFGLLLGPAELDNVFQELFDQLRAVTSPIFVSAAPASPQGEATPPPDAGTDDGAEYVLGAPQAYAGFADAAVSQGALHVVAETHSATATHVQYRRRDADGRWQERLHLTQEDTARFPAVDARGDTVAVVWQDERAGQMPRRPGIFARISRDGGRQFGPEITVAQLDGMAMHPDVAVTADGEVHVVWQQIQPERPFDVFTARIGADGALAVTRNLSGADKAFNAANPFDSRTARYPASVHPAVSVALDGTVWAAWQDNRFDRDPLWTGQASYGEGTDPDDWQIAVRALDDGADTVYLGAADAADRHPDLGFDDAGTLHVVWDSKPLQAAGVNLAVLGSRRAADNPVFSTPESISAQPASSATRPRLGRGVDGTARVAWFDSRSVDWRWRVMTARFEDGWTSGSLIPSRGVNTWPVPAGDRVVFASTRNAERLQRDRTQQIYALNTGAAKTKTLNQQGAALVPVDLAIGFCADCSDTADCHAAHAHHHHGQYASMASQAPRFAVPYRP
ncbi:CehA/McbA family metallohydrolase [Algiphilus sp.]|uniref:CehA/McbA family metallohydrolase n=1 Tax=Algiphilus sp. TaxID=1872431 RepID=UPI003B52D244